MIDLVCFQQEIPVWCHHGSAVLGSLWVNLEDITFHILFLAVKKDLRDRRLVASVEK
jgi:hypothetical protein